MFRLLLEFRELLSLHCGRLMVNSGCPAPQVRPLPRGPRQAAGHDLRLDGCMHQGGHGSCAGRGAVRGMFLRWEDTSHRMAPCLHRSPGRKMPSSPCRRAFMPA